MWRNYQMFHTEIIKHIRIQKSKRWPGHMLLHTKRFGSVFLQCSFLLGEDVSETLYFNQFKCQYIAISIYGAAEETFIMMNVKPLLMSWSNFWIKLGVMIPQGKNGYSKEINGIQLWKMTLEHEHRQRNKETWCKPSVNHRMPYSHRVRQSHLTQTCQLFTPIITFLQFSLQLLYLLLDNK